MEELDQRTLRYLRHHNGDSRTRQRNNARHWSAHSGSAAPATLISIVLGAVTVVVD